MPPAAGRIRRHPVKTWALVLMLGLAQPGSPVSRLSLEMPGVGAKTRSSLLDPRLALVGAADFNTNAILKLMLRPSSLRAEGSPEKLEGFAGQAQTWSFIGPIAMATAPPDFGAAAGRSDLVWYEFAHAIVNPLTEMHRVEVAESAQLLEPIREGMARQGFTQWPIVVNEHIVRALTVVLIRQQRGEEAAAEALRRDVESCFIYLPPLVRWLDEYSLTRSKYPAFSDFYPVMLNVLTSRARAHAAGRFHPACELPPLQGASICPGSLQAAGSHGGGKPLQEEPRRSGHSRGAS